MTRDQIEEALDAIEARIVRIKRDNPGKYRSHHRYLALVAEAREYRKLIAKQEADRWAG